MAPFPKSDVERDALWKFLASDTAGDDQIRGVAERLIARLEGQVRVALVGSTGSGKSALTRLLVGRELIPEAVSGANAPSVLAVHGQKPTLVAGWWNGRRKAFPIDALNGALQERSDYIEFAFPLPILEHISFFDMPAVSDETDQKRRLAWLLKRTDLVLWCKSAEDEWTIADTKLWAVAPSLVHEESVMVVTGVDRIGSTRAGEAMARLSDEAAGEFADIYPIATPIAYKAAPGGAIKDAEAWKSSGGRRLVAGLVKHAAAVREMYISAARAFLEVQGITLPPRSSGKAAAPKPITGADLRKMFMERIDQLVALNSDRNLQDVEPFISVCASTLAELAEMLRQEGIVDPSAAWLADEVADGVRRVNWIARNPSDKGARDAALILLQLSRDISWSIAA